MEENSDNPSISHRGGRGPNPLNGRHCGDEDGRQTRCFPINLLTCCQLRGSVEMAEECRGSGERSPEHGGCVESTATKRVRRPGEPMLAPSRIRTLQSPSGLLDQIVMRS